MDVPAPEARQVQDHLRQNQPVSDHDHQVGFQVGQFSLAARIPEAGRLQYGDAV